ncbi:Serine/threonine-protein kinase [Wickerhamomyces ciferrii]|uniref:Serine/threonine-protein kinase MEC1 n=1 Tax=Wickerhamomyces ciferrii (strain ATCC 14091 / BCRC 22168 / CBS 111 / JCM 3599 / NBRC 0793 / NRRL Y-1031 F-60-10) TaxID=1206466 RepID=K0KLF1_WICCF|nr:Serine/threonine-protein kinase [Wickerhamomyces ciferrii]CCH42199.1 Serine/threonine-protein kinase [Wickerhamomyces ciferrii]
MSNGSTIALDALYELVNAILSGESQDNSSDTQLKLLTIIVKHGIQDNKKPDDWIRNCLSAIEIICEKDPHLLNGESEEPETMIYVWILKSLIPLLSTTELLLVKNVKQTVLTMIHLITTKLRLFSYKKDIKTFFLDTFDTYLTNLFKTSIEDKLISLLSISTNLLSLLTDNEVRSKLLISSIYDQKFESSARKLDYIITGLSRSSEDDKIDTIRSHLILSMLNYTINNEYITYSRFKHFMELCCETIQSPSLTSDVSTQLTISYSLLKALDHCLATENLTLFMNSTAYENTSVIVVKTFPSSSLHQVFKFIGKVISQVNQNDQDIEDITFEEINLENLKMSILTKLSYSDKSTSLVKSLRIEIPESIDTLSKWINHVKKLLEQPLQDNDDTFKVNYFKIIAGLGDFFCAYAGSFDTKTQLCTKCSKSSLNLDHIDQYRQDVDQDNEVHLAYLLFTRFILSDDTVKSDTILSMAATMTIFKIFFHYQPPQIEPNCPFFKFLSSQIISTNRDIRLQSARVLPIYFVSKYNDTDANSEPMFKLLNNINIKSDLYLVESTTMVWGQLAIASEGERLNAILFKLIDLLSSQNPFQSSIAFHEIQIIASAKGKTPWQLLTPSMPDLSLMIAKKLFSKPALGQKISELVGVPLPTILSRTASHTVPYLLTYYKEDLIGEIAKAAGKKKIELVLDNRAKVFAVLLTNVTDVSEGKIHSILSNACPELKTLALYDLLPLIQTVWELLKCYSQEQQNQTEIKNALELALKISDNGNSGKKSLKSLLDRHILGVVQQFSDAIHDTKGLQPYVEKLKAINAIELLVQISGSSIVSALPQIITCLQAALEITLLRESGLRCWKILVQQLEETHLVTILDLSVAIVLQRWESFDNRCKMEAKNLLSAFLEKSETFKTKHVHCFFSLSANDELLEVYTKVHHIIRKNEKTNSLLYDITRRCKNDNKFVVKQALLDLNRFFIQYQSEVYTTHLPRPNFAPVISMLFGVLLDILHKFKLSDDICVQSSKCLGLIGALDPTKYEIEKKRDQMVIASNFEDPKETVRFLLKFIDQHLVPAFWASEDPGKQLFLAYAMQELLKLCGLDSSKFNVNQHDPTSHEYLLWSQFSDISKSTLTPLVSSKYSASLSTYKPISYPIYDVKKTHTKWLRQFTLDCMRKAKGDIAEPIFSVCSSLVKDQDLSFCTFILPYAALNLVIQQHDSEHAESIKTEILTVLSTNLEEVHHLAADSLRLCYESIFNLLDYFRKWIFARKQLLKRRMVKGVDFGIQAVTRLLDSVPQQLMAKRSLQSNSFDRAILYMEQCYRTDSYDDFGTSFFGTLQNMYANVGDIDALDGVLKKFSTKSLNDRITELEYSDNWKMAQDCFEALGSDGGDILKLDADTRLLNSLYNHNLYDQSLQKLENLVKVNEPNVKKEWLNIALEASILSGNLETLSKWMSKFENSNSINDSQLLVNYHIGKALVSLNGGLLDEFKASVEKAQLLIGGHISMNRPATLYKSRSMLVVLHSLSDIDSISKQGSSHTFANTAALMDTRLENTGNDFVSNWYISSMRRVADGIVGNDFNLADISDSWVSSSSLARKHNRIDLATSSIMNAIRLNNANTELEYAKLLWAQGDHSRALKYIEDLKNEERPLSTRDKASIQLKFTKWLDYSNNSSSTKIIEEYNLAIKLDPTWEKNYYALAKYYNKLLDIKMSPSTEKINLKDISGEYERRTINFYLKALQCGMKYIYEALPKVITVWLDFSANIQELPAELQDSARVTVLAERKKHLQHIHDDISKCADKLPKYVWYTVFSQLLSRLLHPNKPTGQIIIMISSLVVSEYPTHALWSVLAQYKSTQQDRSRKAKKILELFENSDSTHPNMSNATLLSVSKKLFNQLIEVSKKQLPKVKGPLSLKDDFEFDHSCVPSPLVVPVKTNFDITLPASVQALKYHNPFPSSSRVTINRFDNRVDVLSSMQQPRHLYLKGSNGYQYGILCKPNDDLRKDAKLMEFTTMVDHLLKRDYESEQRKLHIKTYAVIPLNENHGIIEWVENSRTMRDILKTHYSNINLGLDIPLIRNVLDKDCDVSEKAALFKTEILDKYPPVLYQWFIENFPDPSSWYHARNNYTRTTAVMSMVGYMLGLGDRHGENLLLNEKDGGILHVDFDCLFEKGLELTVPERVPFRMTKNMTDAFGITGVEGTFRKSCEVTLALLRNNETTLMNILESFLHDPIMDWSHKRRTRNTPQSALSTIRRKIRGILDKEGLPMSTQGQAEFLIQQSTSLENLCQMYIGWMAFW